MSPGSLKKEKKTHKGERMESAASDRYAADFEQLEFLGEGGFGKVFKAKNKLDGGIYAIKMIPLSHDQKDFGIIQREVLSLRSLKHDNVVRYHQSWIGSRVVSDENESNGDSDDFYGEDDASEYESEEEESSSESKNENTDDDEDNSESDTETTTRSGIDKSAKTASLTTMTSSVGSDPDSYLLTCNYCNSKYQDWEVSYGDWELLQTGMQTYYLCIKCYSDALAMSGIDPSRVTFQIIAKPQPILRHLFIQMEYCPRVLSGMLADKSLWTECTYETLLKIFFQVVDGLVHIHRTGFVHRDLKPSNIFLDDDYNAKIGDFGLSKALTQAVNHEGSATLHRKRPNQKSNHTSDIGTALYQSPEILEGHHDYDNRVDVYSLGIVFYEMLRPFDLVMERVKTIDLLRTDPQHHDLWSFKIPAKKSSASEADVPVSTCLRDLVTSMVCKDIHHRPKSSHIGRHPIRPTGAIKHIDSGTYTTASCSGEKMRHAHKDIDAIHYNHQQVVMNMQQEIEELRLENETQRKEIERLRAELQSLKCAAVTSDIF